MLVKDMAVGDRLIVGAYRTFGGDRLQDIAWMKVSQNNDFIAAAEIDILEFDSQEPQSPGRERRRGGNSFYPLSNIHNFLNAEREEWYEPTHTADQPPFRLRTGFLKDFEPWERECIEEREIVVAVPEGSKREFGRSVRIRCLVSLPSADELGRLPASDAEDVIVEGESFDMNVFSDGFATMTRTGTGPSRILCYQRRRGFYPRSASNMEHISPVIRLKGDVAVTDSSDEQGFHYPEFPEDSAYYTKADDLAAILTAG